MSKGTKECRQRIDHLWICVVWRTGCRVLWWAYSVLLNHQHKEVNEKIKDRPEIVFSEGWEKHHLSQRWVSIGKKLRFNGGAQMDIFCDTYLFGPRGGFWELPPQHYQNRVQSGEGKAQSGTPFPNRSFWNWCWEALHTICDAQKLCFAENTILGCLCKHGSANCTQSGYLPKKVGCVSNWNRCLFGLSVWSMFGFGWLVLCFVCVFLCVLWFWWLCGCLVAFLMLFQKCRSHIKCNPLGYLTWP